MPILLFHTLMRGSKILMTKLTKKMMREKKEKKKKKKPRRYRGKKIGLKRVCNPN
jgi:hypothetical protein